MSTNAPAVRLIGIGLALAAVIAYSLDSIIAMTALFVLAALVLATFAFRASVRALARQRASRDANRVGRPSGFAYHLRRFSKRGEYLIDIEATKIVLTIRFRDELRQLFESRLPAPKRIFDIFYDDGFNGTEATFLCVFGIHARLLQEATDEVRAALRDEFTSVLTAQLSPTEYKESTYELTRIVGTSQLFALDWMQEGKVSQACIESAFGELYQSLELELPMQPFPLFPRVYREIERTFIAESVKPHVAHATPAKDETPPALPSPTGETQQ